MLSPASDEQLCAARRKGTDRRRVPGPDINSRGNRERSIHHIKRRIEGGGNLFVQNRRGKAPPTSLICELHRPAQNYRLGRSAGPHQISYKTDTISVPTPAGSCCKYNEGATTAGHENVVGVALLVDGAVERGVGIVQICGVPLCENM